MRLSSDAELLADAWSSLAQPTELDQLTARWREKPLSREDAAAFQPAKRSQPDVRPFAKLTDMSDPVGKRKEDPFDDGSGGQRAVVAGVEISF